MEKTTKHPSTRHCLTVLVMAGSFILFQPIASFAQGQGKKEKPAKPSIQSTLPEANVTASLNADFHQVNPLQVNLNLLNPAGKFVNVYIRNYRGRRMFQESFRHREYSRTFNFSQTPSDIYFFHINSRNHTEKLPFRIILNKQRSVVSGELMNQGASDLMAAIYEYEPFKIRVDLVNTSEKPILYFIRNGNNKIIFQGKTKDADFSEVFQLEDLDSGKYTFEIKTRDEKISRTFDLQTSEQRSFVWVDKRGQPIAPAPTAQHSLLINP
jgi:hypothetical protein